MHDVRLVAVLIERTLPAWTILAVSYGAGVPASLVNSTEIAVIVASAGCWVGVGVEASSVN